MIGTGNVASVLGKRFRLAGLEVVQVYGRSPQRASALAGLLDAAYCSEWDDITPDADVYLVALSDSALEQLPAAFVLGPQQLLLHTAGSVGVEVLVRHAQHYGVLYPLQSLRATVPVITEIPFLVESSSTFGVEIIARIGLDMGCPTAFVSSAERLRLHIAAVCTNNFCNHIYALVSDFCEKEGVDFSLLSPLARETAARLGMVAPQSVVTGPAIRNDEETIRKHLFMLEETPLLRMLYAGITENIQAYYGKKDDRGAR